LSEEIYQNLAIKGASGEPSGVSRRVAPESVHHCDFPEVREELIDADLSADMEALLDLVTLGSAARNSVKIKVRQPLAEMRVQTEDATHRRAAERFGDQICDELNIKQVFLHDPSADPLVQQEVRANLKTLGPKLGPRLREAQEALAKANAAEIAKKVAAGQPIELPAVNGPILLEPADVGVQLKGPDGWAVAVNRDTIIAIDARITEPLKQEGMARDVVRHVQQLRRDADLEMSDRIVLYLHTESTALRAAIDKHRDYIAAETLTVQWSDHPLGPGAAVADLKVVGQPLQIELRKV
jgi:isoleucyl-tRNA synthetase